MEEFLRITGCRDEQLMMALQLALKMNMCSPIKEIFYYGQGTDESEDVVLYFSEKEVKYCDKELPVGYDAKILFDIIKKWLVSFERRPMSGDGCTGRGWTLETGLFGEYSLKVKFTTMYYGK